MIELKNVSCHFDKKTVLESVSLQIKEHLTLLGANGAGKSTLAKILCNIVPFEGDIFIEGKQAQKLQAKERAKLISYIPPKLEVYEQHITVFEFILLGRFPYKSSFFDYSEADKKIARDSLELLNLVHLTGTLLSSLSSGESQLTLIAQALAQQSKIIIFDEPTANLDPKNSTIIAKHIKRLKETHTIILITHDISLASFIDSPVAFVKEKIVHYFEKNFFEEKNLQALYGVAFKELTVQYD